MRWVILIVVLWDCSRNTQGFCISLVSAWKSEKCLEIFCNSLLWLFLTIYTFFGLFACVNLVVINLCAFLRAKCVIVSSSSVTFTVKNTFLGIRIQRTQCVGYLCVQNTGLRNVVTALVVPEQISLGPSIRSHLSFLRPTELTFASNLLSATCFIATKQQFHCDQAKSTHVLQCEEKGPCSHKHHFSHGTCTTICQQT